MPSPATSKYLNGKAVVKKAGRNNPIHSDTEAEYHQLYSMTQLTGHEVYQQDNQSLWQNKKTEASPNIYCSLRLLPAKRKQAKILLTKTHHDSI